MKRRDFLSLVAASAGSTYAAMIALDLLSQPAKASKKLELKPINQPKTVIVLGAGVAGLCAAYELEKLGYHCVILEANNRIGGRCFTVRNTTKSTEIDGQTQQSTFDEDLYFNAGATRIAQHHVTLDYCQELGVPIEPFNHVNEAAYYYQVDVGKLSNKKIRIREIKQDFLGYKNELLAKAINQDALDLELTKEDQEKLVTFLQLEGNLSPDLFYKGSRNRGYSTLPGASLNPGVIESPFDLSAIIQYGFSWYILNETTFNHQISLLQIVGGIDQLSKAFVNKIKGKISLESPVQEIRKTTTGVKIIYLDKQQKRQSITGDYCICTIPLTVLKSIPSDFSQPMKQAISSIPYMATSKVGLQFKRRFWEEDDRIFGGISYTNQNITQIFYPSDHFFSQKGILVGAYNYEEKAQYFGNLSIQEREKLVLQQGSKIHPQYLEEFESGFYVPWHKLPYNLGGWAMYNTDMRKTVYPQLNQPDDHIYLAGEHLSYYPGWITGSLESSRHVVAQLNERVHSLG
ncbi:amine oxidase [Rippkaea orientalis PCC 8801]|uniref:Amine oxidase n=1 Tax=Rippkaea orientalis (strain PCC 8801 / RF-1) TaxID=41431 RepID=B7K0F4_RIPO1|nr:flavin monoamine oxidase family protein [Rippkaea orientalis]ACK67438.1 amine oxidase [Rippkaea orientalis PCC 8801]